MAMSGRGFSRICEGCPQSGADVWRSTADYFVIAGCCTTRRDRNSVKIVISMNGVCGMRLLTSFAAPCRHFFSLFFSLALQSFSYNKRNGKQLPLTSAAITGSLWRNSLWYKYSTILRAAESESAMMKTRRGLVARQRRRKKAGANLCKDQSNLAHLDAS